jgi:hypothetical protein
MYVNPLGLPRLPPQFQVSACCLSDVCKHGGAHAWAVRGLCVGLSRETGPVENGSMAACCAHKWFFFSSGFAWVS